MADIKYYDVILKPVITERSMAIIENKKYTFLVHPTANKIQIKEAVETLYGSWSALPQSSVEFIEQTLEKKNYIEAFEKIRGSEKMNSAVLRAFEADYPGILSESNLDEILRSATQMLQDEEEEKSEESLTQSM